MELPLFDYKIFMKLSHFSFHFKIKSKERAHLSSSQIAEGATIGQLSPAYSSCNTANLFETHLCHSSLFHVAHNQTNVISAVTNACSAV